MGKPRFSSRGLTKLLPRVFFPRFSVRKLVQRPRNPGGLQKRRARVRGCRIDTELKHLALHGNLPPRSTAETKLVHAFLLQERATVLGAQVYVACARWNAVTYLDLVLQVPGNTQDDAQIVVAEIKRGCVYRDCSVPNTLSRHLQPAVPTAPRHLHELQALTGARLWELQEQRTVNDVWLMYVDENGLEVSRRADFGVRWSRGVEQALVDWAAASR